MNLEKAKLLAVYGILALAVLIVFWQVCHFDFINFEGGYGPYNPIFASGSGFTYGEFTLGLNYKPAKIPAVLSGLVIRPELRYDTAFSGGKPYDLKWDGSEYVGTKRDQFTFGLDIVVPFHR